MYFYMLFLGYVTCFDLPPDWINPSDFHHSRKVGELAENIVSAQPESITNDQQVLAVEPNTIIKNTSCICPPHQQSPCDSYMKRIINLLLVKTTMKNYRLPEDNNRIVPMALYFTSKNLEILHAYASSDTYKTFTWSDFDQAFSSLFQTPEIIQKTDEYIGPQQDYAVFIFISIVGSMLIVGLWLLLKTGSFYKSVCGFVVINFCCALIWNLMRAYHKEKERLMQLHGIRLISDQNKSSWWEFLNPFKNDKDDIQLLPEYEPIFNIDYGKIFVETLCSIFHILPLLGQQIGDMVANFYSSQNFFGRWIVQPLQVFFSPFILIIFLFLLAIVIKGFTIKLPLFSLDIHKKEEVQQRLDVSQQQQRNRLQPAVRAYYNEDSTPVATIQEDIYVAGPSRSTVPLKRAQTEYILTESPVRNTNQRPPAVTCTRKGPWQGSVVRYGFIKKRIVPNRYKEEFGN